MLNIEEWKKLLCDNRQFYKIDYDYLNQFIEHIKINFRQDMLKNIYPLDYSKKDNKPLSFIMFDQKTMVILEQQDEDLKSQIIPINKITKIEYQEIYHSEDEKFSPKVTVFIDEKEIINIDSQQYYDRECIFKYCCEFIRKFVSIF